MSIKTKTLNVPRRFFLTSGTGFTVPTLRLLGKTPTMRSRFADEAWASRIKDQGQTSACTGFALASLVEALVSKRRARAKRETKSCTPISPFMLYFFAREVTTRFRAMLSMRGPQLAAQ